MLEIGTILGEDKDARRVVAIESGAYVLQPVGFGPCTCHSVAQLVKRYDLDPEAAEIRLPNEQEAWAKLSTDVYRESVQIDPPDLPTPSEVFGDA
jgi:hypothetical protein